MAVSANALSLAQYALLSNDPLVRGITFSLYEAGNVMQDIPFVNKKSLVLNGTRWTGSLPTVNWSKINVDPVVTTGTPSAYQESAFIVRNAIDTDRVLVEDENQISDPRVAMTDAWMKGYSYDVNNKFINNDHVTGNADAIVGVRYRLDNPYTYGLSGDTKIDCGGATNDMSPAGLTATTANGFFEILQSMFDAMGAFEGEGIVLYMSALMKRRIERAIRVMGAGAGFDTTRDEFGRSVAMYRNAKIRYIGRQADQVTEIITNTETNTGAAGSSTFTSIYAVRYGLQDMFGWQFDPLKAQDIGLIGNGGSTFRTVIDHVWGLNTPNIRSLGRLYDIKVA